TAGGIGTPGKRIQLDGAPSDVTVGAGTAPTAGVYLDGLTDLMLGPLTTQGATLDVTARGNLTAGGAVATGSGAVLLGADLKADGSGEDGTGTLTLEVGV